MANQQAVLSDNLGQDAKSFRKGFGDNPFSKGFPQGLGLKKVQE
jgi:hypothetical protein